MKQIVLSFSDAALFAEIAIILFVGIFLVALYRITFVSPQRQRQYARCAYLALEDSSNSIHVPQLINSDRKFENARTLCE